jgi:hypothetical protein
MFAWSQTWWTICSIPVKSLVRFLPLLADLGHESPPIPLIVSLSQESIAGLMGTTSLHVGLLTNRFKGLGFSGCSGGIMHVYRALVRALLQD